MRYLINSICLLALLVPTMPSQTTVPSTSLAFEVASIRLNPGPWHELQGFSSSGPNLRMIAWNVISLIIEAYDLRDYEVVYPGAVYPLDMYDIAAKAEGEVPRTRAEFRRMLQSLLNDRFQLKFHREMKKFAVYFLTVGKNGPTFREAPSDANRHAMVGVEGRKYILDLSLTSMQTLAKNIHSTFFVKQPVLDKTGLTGIYDIKLAATPEFMLLNSSEPGDIDIFTAVQSQLGLRLESGKAEVEVLVIDHIEKPSAN